MVIPNLGNLPSKFRPFLVGSPNCPTEQEIGEVFKGTLQDLKGGYIFSADKWILKCERKDQLQTTPDTHLYRLRKAEKIRTYIQQNKLEEHLKVPRKYIYWHKEESKFYLVDEKMELSDEVVTPASAEIEAIFKGEGAILGGQTQALASGALRRSLTRIQAKALAELSVLGYTDLSYNNLYFTKDQKVAIIDTEPQKRFLKKRCKSNFLYYFLGDKGVILSEQSIAGIAKLKLCADSPEVLEVIQKVEKNHVLWRSAVLVAKISLVTLALYFTSTKVRVSRSLKIGFIAFLVLKNLVLTLNLVGLYSIWVSSCQGVPGLRRIIGLEEKGVI